MWIKLKTNPSSKWMGRDWPRIFTKRWWWGAADAARMRVKRALTEEQYAAFAARLKSTPQFQFMQLCQVARLVGGWE